MNDGLGDLWTYAADDAIRAHQPRGGDRFQKMLSYNRIDGRNPGYVDDRDLRVRVHDRFEEGFHHNLGTSAVQSSDQGQSKDSIPQFYDWGRQFQHVFLRSPNDFLF